MSSCTYTLVRHGETYWNKAEKVQGQVNIPLNELGKEQARKAGETLKDEPFEICYTSPLDRSSLTAKLVLGDKDVEIIENPLLMEQAYGLVEGENISDVMGPGGVIENYIRPLEYVPVIGGESFPEMLERANKAIDEILIPAAEDHDNVLISSHGCLIASLIVNMFDVPLENFWDYRLPNAGYFTVRYEDGKWTRLN